MSLSSVESECFFLFFSPSGNEATPEVKQELDEDVENGAKDSKTIKQNQTTAFDDARNAAAASDGAAKAANDEAVKTAPGAVSKRDEYDLGLEPEIELDFDEDFGKFGDEEEAEGKEEEEEEEKPMVSISEEKEKKKQFEDEKGLQKF